jgi:hypothetical protein
MELVQKPLPAPHKRWHIVKITIQEMVNITQNRIKY